VSWTPDHSGDRGRAGADELFAELSRIDRAPDDLTARVMGQVGYRPVTTLEAGRRRRNRTMIRVAAFGLATVGLAAAGLHLRATEGRPVDGLTVETAVARDVTNARSRVASALTGLRRMAPPVGEDAATDAGAGRPVMPGTPAAMLVAEDSGEPAAEAGAEGTAAMPAEIRGLFTELRAPADSHGPERATIDLELAPPMPRFGPGGFPSGGRGIDRLAPAWLPPSGGAERPTRATGVEDARLGPLTLADPVAWSESRA
jgi:hypothetical protein